ncbi:MAG: lipid-binding SYLF domain-containing protein [Gammaproteobacteria bacterium]|nr:lipid-binding SYLF domain-containing protein [Gammaproteobacteria bacterium]
MQRFVMPAVALMLGAVLPVAGRAAGSSREEARLLTAATVLEEFRREPDRGLPTWLLERAYGVAVVPEVIKGALIFGGRHGRGVMTIRDASGRFGNPIFISLTGGSVGFQWGAQATDVVLVFATRRSVDEFGRGAFTLGASGSVAAGPIGRAGEAAAGVSAEVYAYSRSRGLFAGVALDGTLIRFDSKANRRYYNTYDISTAAITSGRVQHDSESARRFLAAVASSANVPSAQPVAAPAQAQPQPSTAAPAPAAGAQSFPMEDPRPGAEPP